MDVIGAKVGEIDIKVETKSGNYLCKGVIREGVVMSGSDYRMYPGVSEVTFPQNFASFKDDDDIVYEQGCISELICFAINDGGVDSSLWEDIELWFEITSIYDRRYPFRPQH